MNDVGPIAPIAKYVLVRAPRPVNIDRLSVAFIARPGGNTPFWHDLRGLSTESASQPMIDRSRQFLDSTPMLSGLTGPFSTLIDPVSRFDALKQTLQLSGLSKALDELNAQRLVALFEAGSAANTQALVLGIWDQIAARLIAQSDPGELPPLFALLRLLHVSRLASPSSATPLTPGAFDAEVLLPEELVDFIKKSKVDAISEVKAQRAHFNQLKEETLKSQFTDAVLANAAVQIVDSAIKQSDLTLHAVPAATTVEQPGDNKSFSTLNLAGTFFRLNAHALGKVTPEIADYVRRRFGIPDVSAVDAIVLSKKLHDDLAANSSSLFSYSSANIAIDGTKHLNYLASEFIGGRIDNLGNATAVAMNRFPLGVFSAVPSGKLPPVPGDIKPAGVADLKVVHQQLQKYQLGEISYIENVLAGEARERVFNNLERTEQQLVIETQESTTSERDLQTTDRFELSQEISALQKESRSSEAGVTVSASYGPVSLAAHAQTQDANSSETAVKNARSSMKETVAKAVERIQRQVRRQQTTTITAETTETNKHQFAANDKSVVGVYRYVEKYYWCQTLNYGARLMLEFMIPEAAAFYLYAQDPSVQPVGGVTAPDEPKFTARDINDTNYLALSSKYKAQITRSAEGISV